VGVRGACRLAERVPYMHVPATEYGSGDIMCMSYRQLYAPEQVVRGGRHINEHE